jgi:hypothetical protein
VYTVLRPTLFFHPDPKTFYWKFYNILEILSSSGTKWELKVCLKLNIYKNITNDNSYPVKPKLTKLQNKKKYKNIFTAFRTVSDSEYVQPENILYSLILTLRYVS